MPRSASGQDRLGRIEGRLLNTDGRPVAGAQVTVAPGGQMMTSAADGSFSFLDLVPGRYVLTLVRPDTPAVTRNVEVKDGESASVEQIVDWTIILSDVVVQGASRSSERLIDAPAAVTVINQREIERQSLNGEVAKLLEFTPSAQVTQGGSWDFNIGTRGFNRALSRRVAVILDNHDLSLPFFGYQGWATFSFPLDDLAGLELVRGPDAAFYGSNASGGVISMRSKEPRLNQGETVRIGVGQRDTMNLEGRWAGQLSRHSGDDDTNGAWYARTVGGVRRSNGIATSRVGGPEYSVACAPGGFGDCLPAESVPFDGEDADIFYAGLRVDGYLRNRVLLTTEGGYAQGGYGVYQASGQRAKSIGTDGKRPWARVDISDFADHRFDIAASYDGYYEPSGYVGLTTGLPFNSSAHRVQVEGRTHWRLAPHLIELSAGGMAALEKMDSFNAATSSQTFLFHPVASDKQALFGGGTWQATPRVSIVGALRGDWSSLHSFQLSPKASVSYKVASAHSLRATFSSGFQTPNSLEYFLQAAVAPPVDLSGLNAFCAPFGVNCRFGQTPVLALGNEDLGVETVKTWEAGYVGALSRKTVISAEYYVNRSSHLATSLLPQIGTPLGRLNPRFGQWQPPAGLPELITEQIRALVPLLSNGIDGSNILAAASYAEFARAATQGIDIFVDHEFAPGWRSTAAYSWFDFHLPRSERAAEGLLLPNTPPHAFSAGLAHERGRLSGDFRFRWVDHFRWADGYFLGNVESYSTSDATVTFKTSPQTQLIFNGSNLFDDRHWETFGGSIVSRRLLLGLQYNWTRHPKTG